MPKLAFKCIQMEVTKGKRAKMEIEEHFRRICASCGCIRMHLTASALKKYLSGLKYTYLYKIYIYVYLQYGIRTSIHLVDTGQGKSGSRLLWSVRPDPGLVSTVDPVARKTEAVAPDDCRQAGCPFGTGALPHFHFLVGEVQGTACFHDRSASLSHEHDTCSARPSG